MSTSTLLQRYLLRCPYQRAREYLEAKLHGAADTGETQVIRLRAPFAQKGMALEKDVLISFGRAIDPLHFDQPWTIHWTADGGPYPEFDGTLTVRADEDYGSAVLELQGTYIPPFGLAGTAFDALLGSRIASATAREFLGTMAAEMESEFEAEAHGKTVNGA
jgi:hypothetical protein